MKYRKKPVEIDAFKWTGGPDQTEDPMWIIDAMQKPHDETGAAWIQTVNDPEKGPYILMRIKTLEGVMKARPGDYIIRGVQGELYSCKPDIFEQTYQRADTPIAAPEECTLVAHHTGDGWALAVEDQKDDVSDVVCYLAWPKTWPPQVNEPLLRAFGFEII